MRLIALLLAPACVLLGKSSNSDPAPGSGSGSDSLGAAAAPTRRSYLPHTRNYALFMIAGGILAGCNGSGLFYQPMMPYQATPKAPADVQVIAMGDPPPCKSKTIGHAVSSYGPGGPTPLDRIRGKAAELGADGVKNFMCGGPGTVGQNRCDGDIYVCE